MLSNYCCKICVRFFSGSSVLFSKNLSRESRFLNKIMSKNSIKRNHKVVHISTPTLFPEKNAKAINSKRVTVLNKLFMKYITDIMSTGNIDPVLMEKGLEISRVAITPDFLNLNVFWYSQSLNNEESIDQRLQTAAHKIHHELSQLHLMGFVPKICFIQDRKKNQIEELERVFQTLDLTEREESDEIEDDAIFNTNLPSMTSNIYGLDHEKIMRKVVVAKGKRINKLKTVHKDEEFCPENCNPETK